jgi:hypothetical protein
VIDGGLELVRGTQDADGQFEFPTPQRRNEYLRSRELLEGNINTYRARYEMIPACGCGLALSIQRYEEKLDLVRRNTPTTLDTVSTTHKITENALFGA